MLRPIISLSSSVTINDVTGLTDVGSERVRNMMNMVCLSVPQYDTTTTTTTANIM